MCGIAGIMDSVGRRPIDRAQLVQMTDRIAHRGPDGDGFHVAPGIGLGHRRLAIIDVTGGHQPMFNEDETVVVTFNGEIYNFQGIAAELIAKGHRFRTHSDTEVIVHAWEEWGEECVKRFTGMFAFALWDERQETLFLARDRFGEKPLYYAVLDNGLVLFASELKALLRRPDLPRHIDPTRDRGLLLLRLCPGEQIDLSRRQQAAAGAHADDPPRPPGPAPRAYWDLSFDGRRRSARPRPPEELIARLRDAVKARLISEVPLGAFLSGGVDSSAVVAMMAETSDLVDSFSIGFTQAAFDESEYAGRIAAQYKTRHHSRIVDADDFDLVEPPGRHLRRALRRQLGDPDLPRLARWRASG